MSQKRVTAALMCNTAFALLRLKQSRKTRFRGLADFMVNCFADRDRKCRSCKMQWTKLSYTCRHHLILIIAILKFVVYILEMIICLHWKAGQNFLDHISTFASLFRPAKVRSRVCLFSIHSLWWDETKWGKIAIFCADAKQLLGVQISP